MSSKSLVVLASFFILFCAAQAQPLLVDPEDLDIDHLYQPAATRQEEFKRRHHFQHKIEEGLFDTEEDVRGYYRRSQRHQKPCSKAFGRATDKHMQYHHRRCKNHKKFEVLE
jgi:hypothetical protein